MKKRLIVLFAAMSVIGLPAKSQSVSFGVKAGMTGSNLKATASGISIGMTTKIGFYAGVTADIDIADNFGIQPELFYSLMGASIKVDTGTGVIVSGKDNYGYVNLPILFKYKNEGFAVFIGPQISALISAKEKFGSASEDVKDELKTTDFSGIIGASYTLANGFGIDARYQLGFGNIYKEAEGIVLRNNGFMVGVHYFFNQ